MSQSPTLLPTSQPPPPPVLPPMGPPEPRRNRPGRAFGTSVVVASIVLGGAAGLGGAAAWDAMNTGGEASVPNSSPSPTTARVVDTPDQPAADGSVEQVAATVLPSVVKIDVSDGTQAGSGSGIVLSSDGEILTNFHVVEVAGDAGSISVSFNDGTTAEASIVGIDPLTDTALIKAEGVDGLTPATIGRSGDLAVGEEVVAIGSPFGLDATVTSGIVSALDRPVGVGSDSEGNTTAYPAVQTDAAINPGNSGGPLVDLTGNVVGINSSIRTNGSSAEEAGSIGLGFAIPIDEVVPIVEQMRAGETPTHARLGISVADIAGDGGLPSDSGAEVQAVSEGSTAAEGGLEAGDVVSAVDGTLIADSDSLVATIRSYRPGDTVIVTFERDGESDTAELTLDSDATAE